MRFRSGGIHKGRFDDRNDRRGGGGRGRGGDRGGDRRGGRGDRRGGRGDRRGGDKEDRLPKDKDAAKDKLDEQLLKFQQKHGINTEAFTQAHEAAKATKLDTQLQEFMAKAKQTKEEAPRVVVEEAGNPEITAETRQVTEAK